MTLSALLVLVALTVGSNSHMNPPPQYPTRAFCAQRVWFEGDNIADHRWVAEPQTPEVKLHQYVDVRADEAPMWFIDQVHSWIKSAYAFQGDRSEWLAKILGECNDIVEPEGDDT